MSCAGGGRGVGEYEGGEEWDELYWVGLATWGGGLW